MTISTNGTIITRLAGTLYGVYLSNASYTEVSSTAPATVAANWLSNDFSSKTDAQIATTVLTNLGLTTANGFLGEALVNYVASQLTASGSTATSKGAKLVSMLNDYAGMTADATYGTNATSFNTQVNAALALSQTTGNIGGTFAAAGVVVVSAKTFTLTTGIDSFTGTALGDTFTATTASTLSALDSIDGGAGNDVLNVTVGTTMPTFTALTNIETINAVAAGAFTINTATGYTGLTALSVSDPTSGAISITGAATTALYLCW
jgi:S-layer protein